jgi:hypothetical protein
MLPLTHAVVYKISHRKYLTYCVLNHRPEFVYNPLAFSVSSTLVQFPFSFFISFGCFFIFPAHQLIALSTGPLAKLMLALLSYGTRRFITVFT